MGTLTYGYAHVPVKCYQPQNWALSPPLTLRFARRRGHWRKTNQTTNAITNAISQTHVITKSSLPYCPSSSLWHRSCTRNW